MRRLGVQGLIFFQLGEPPILPRCHRRLSYPLFQSRLLRGHTLLASPPELDIFFRTRCLVPSCECGSRFCRRWQVPSSLCRYIFSPPDLGSRGAPASVPTEVSCNAENGVIGSWLHETRLASRRTRKRWTQHTLRAEAHTLTFTLGTHSSCVAGRGSARNAGQDGKVLTLCLAHDVHDRTGIPPRRRGHAGSAALPGSRLLATDVEGAGQINGCSNYLELLIGVRDGTASAFASGFMHLEAASGFLLLGSGNMDIAED
ncbi:unnamed protein product [Trichogramma brassicae]|uniref:Uncharacterized protein n=1 Tax=Trichogramma brassicae TaxID=86971 RepID=A0A6H5J504_9HYME|nr:unnamed protein product [Trichogramma brassicae]